MAPMAASPGRNAHFCMSKLNLLMKAIRLVMLYESANCLSCLTVVFTLSWCFICKMCVSPSRNAHVCKPCEGIMEPKSRCKSASNEASGSVFAFKRANLGPKLVVQNAAPTFLDSFFGHLWPLAVAPLLCQSQSCAKKESIINMSNTQQHLRVLKYLAALWRE